MARVATTFRNSHLQAIADALDNGYLRIYDGTRPANANTALAGNTLLTEHRFSATAETSVASGVLTFAAVTSDDGLANGTPTFARLLQSDGTTVVADLSASGSGGGGEVEISAASVVTGATVDISSATITYPAA